ncbi:MAG: hypothetical protein ACYSUT_05975 [Planctomycetota bacterium]
MDYQMITEQLLELLAERDVVIRKESMDSERAGLCRLKGQKTFIYNPKSPTFETAIRCAEAARIEIDDIESIYLRPAIRDFIDKYGSDG